MNLVWDSSLDGPSKRFVLLALADRASDEGECASLGVSALCRKTGIKRSTVFTLLRELELEQLIKREEQTRANGSRQASRIWINMLLLAAMRRGDADVRDGDGRRNPFGVSAAQPPVQILDGGSVDNSRTPVQILDPLPVQKLDGAPPESGPLDPISTSDRDPDPERTDGELAPRSERERHVEFAAALVAELDLSQCGPSSKQRFQIVNAIADALDRGVAVEAVADHALRKASEAKTVKYFVRAFSAEYLPTDAARASPECRPLAPPCGQCDGRPNEPASTRVLWVDADKTQSEPCPRCHPQALSA
jgi:hypothetical protein